jgi:hypothetical protein
LADSPAARALAKLGRESPANEHAKDLEKAIRELGNFDTKVPVCSLTPLHATVFMEQLRLPLIRITQSVADGVLSAGEVAAGQANCTDDLTQRLKDAVNRWLAAHPECNPSETSIAEVCLGEVPQEILDEIDENPQMSILDFATAKWVNQEAALERAAAHAREIAAMQDLPYQLGLEPLAESAAQGKLYVPVCMAMLSGCVGNRVICAPQRITERRTSFAQHLSIFGEEIAGALTAVAEGNFNKQDLEAIANLPTGVAVGVQLILGQKLVAFIDAMLSQMVNAAGLKPFDKKHVLNDWDRKHLTMEVAQPLLACRFLTTNGAKLDRLGGSVLLGATKFEATIEGEKEGLVQKQLVDGFGPADALLFDYEGIPLVVDVADPDPSVLIGIVQAFDHFEAANIAYSARHQADIVQLKSSNTMRQDAAPRWGWAAHSPRGFRNLLRGRAIPPP